MINAEVSQRVGLLAKWRHFATPTRTEQPRFQGAFSWLWRWGAPPPKPGKSALGTRLRPESILQSCLVSCKLGLLYVNSPINRKAN